MIITITYTNGNTLTESVNYAVIQNGELITAARKNPSPVYVQPVHVPFENIASLTIDPNDERFNVYEFKKAE